MDLTTIRSVRDKLAQDGPHSDRFTTVSLPAADGDRLRDLLIAEQAATVIEIGLAYGSSALAIGEALATAGGPSPRHIVIDPFQHSAYDDAGWQTLCAAGLDEITTLETAWSSVVLPRLLADGLVADAAFVDGSHRFHEVFTDCYYLRKIVRPGGLIVFDDIQWPSVGTAVRYFEVNLGWEPVPGATGERCRAIRLPDTLDEPLFEDFRTF
ncbi:class I SAM-dependent methyltransferase [Actinoplanes rectilineatus]|uniref:class I SAM-dependent methyltransferase n=1 Tax=Actinoplanes rectilineatus TaxID=113571 RepID=UPI0005F28D63|nr:class I SAM-dependent methyltransferase [Actinoplanes rectilineatus]